jgi:Flp pilus assembly protein TadG
MRCVPYQSLKSDTGSAVTGFALVAPLLVGVFIVVIQIGSVLADRATLMLAAQSGVRVASTFNGTSADGRAKALSVLQSRGMDTGTVITFHDEHRGTVGYVVCEASSHRHITWLNKDITFSTTARAIDESSL